MDKKILENKVAIITGSESGIGQAIAIEFAKAGAHVAITYYTDKSGAEKTQNVVNTYGVKSTIINLDVKEEKSVQSMFKTVISELGEPFILVNNAARMTKGKVVDLPLSEWDEVIRTNLYGPFLCSKEFIKIRLAQGGKGKIINITSVHQEVPGEASYCSAKGGLRNFTECLAIELAENFINVNNIAPGMILTPMNQEAIDDIEKLKEQVKPIPLKRAGMPEEIAKLALYLAGPDSDYATGATFTLDGGLTKMLGKM